jgi:hypothetical protein
MSMMQVRLHLTESELRFAGANFRISSGKA